WCRYHVPTGLSYQSSCSPVTVLIWANFVIYPVRLRLANQQSGPHHKKTVSIRMQHSKHHRMIDAVFFRPDITGRCVEAHGSCHFRPSSASDCRVYVSYEVLALTRQRSRSCWSIILPHSCCCQPSPV